MQQKIYILTSPHNEFVAGKIKEQLPNAVIIPAATYELTNDILRDMAKACSSEYFYIIKTDREPNLDNFNFTFSPDAKNKKYMHVWGDDIAIRLLHTDTVLNYDNTYTDEQLEKGNIPLKQMNNRIVYPQFDIIFLSYDEPTADKNYAKLVERFPRAKRLHNIPGIYEAHKSAARWAEYDKSEMFYVVDADAEILPSFNFGYIPQSIDCESVHVWHALNPVNNLEYGYGGIKLFPTKALIDYTGSPIDFTTSVAKSFIVIPELSNITRFNTDPFSAWRSGFRECTKLASKIITNHDNAEAEHRLSTWCNVGADAEFGDFVIMGANEGREFGTENKDKPELLGLINDFNWLANRFSG